MSTCLRSKRPEVRILSGVPLPIFPNQQVADGFAVSSAAAPALLDPIASTSSVPLNYIRAGVL